MTKTVITHFYNEQYLLPAWLKHHKQIFDKGILIDYHSTDDSVAICLDICPEWQVIPSRNKCFDAQAVDQEVMHIERDLQGWRMCLNVTEFLSGNISLLTDTSEPTQYLVPCVALVGSEWGEHIHMDETILDQATTGIPYQKDFNLRAARSIHNHAITYDVGRHFWTFNCEDLCVFWTGYWPWNSHTLARKMQIQTQIPEHDKQMRRGHHHIKTEQEFSEWWRTGWLPKAECVKHMVQQHQHTLKSCLTG